MGRKIAMMMIIRSTSMAGHGRRAARKEGSGALVLTGRDGVVWIRLLFNSFYSLLEQQSINI